MADLIIKLKKELESFVPLNWFCAVSGGTDSVALLYLLNKSFPRKKIVVVHINHHWHELSSSWENLVVSHAQALSCSLKIFHDHVKICTEKQARKKRLDVFSEILNEKSVVFLGHHLDDQIETSLWRWMRGNWHDLSGMNFQSKVAQGLMVRPFLKTPKKDLQNFISENSIPVIDDPSNQDLSLTRNFLRHQILPILKNNHLFSEKAFIKARDNFSSHHYLFSNLLPDVDKKKIIDLSSFFHLGHDFLVSVLCKWIKSFEHPQCSNEALQVFIKQSLQAGKDKMPLLSLLGGVKIYCYKKKFYWTMSGDREESQSLTVEQKSETLVFWANQSLRMKNSSAEIRSFSFVKPSKNDKVFSKEFPNGLKVSRLWSLLDIPPFARWRYPFIKKYGEFVQLGELCINEKYLNSGEYFIYE